MTKQFINLRNYTENTFLKAIPFERDYIEKAKELKLNAVAMTDINNIYSGINFIKGALNEGIKPLLGVNLMTQGKLHNVVIFPKSHDIGYINLIKIITDRNLEEANFNGLSFYKDNLDILRDLVIIIDYNTYKQFPKYYDFIIERKKELGTEVVFEIQMRNTKSDFEDAKKILGIDNLIISSPTYYIENTKNFGIDDISDEMGKKLFEALDQGTIIDKLEVDFSNLHFKTLKEIKKDFSYILDSDFDKILTNINSIVDSINVDVKMNRMLIPTFELPKEHQDLYDKNISKSNLHLGTDEWYLRFLCITNLDFRYNIKLKDDELYELIGKDTEVHLDKELKEYEIPELYKLSTEHWSKKKREIISNLTEYEQKILSRLEYELFVIDKMGYNAYFLIVADYINWARKNKIPVGPGRGSAAGAILAYLSGITDIDPIKYELLFERFQNPSRVSMPDIDTDFADIDRQRVIDYCAEKYGRDRVTNILTFGTFAAKGAMKDAGRGLGIPFAEMNRLTGKMNPKPGTKLVQDYEDNTFFREEIDNSEDYTKTYHLAQKIYERKKQIGTHACAVIIAPESMLHFTPLQYPPKDKEKIITQYDAHVLEDIGLLKMDFLGLKNLSVVKYALDLIKKNHGIDVDMLKIDTEDIKVYEKIFQTGRTANIFQFESDGMKKYLKELKPDCFDDLIAMVSLYRPGPLAFIPSYIARKHGQEPVTYMHPDLEPIMKVTQGTCLTGDSKVLFENGEYVEIKDIVDNSINKDKKVISTNMETGEIEYNNITHLFDNGEKDFYEVILNNNTNIKSTLTHKYIVYSDNQIKKIELQNLTENDFILNLDSNINIESSVTYHYDRLLILAYLIGDGYLGYGSHISFINKDDILLNNFRKSVLKEFPTSNFSESIRGKDVRTIVVQDKNNVNNYKNNKTLLSYLREIGLKTKNHKDKGLTSKDKYIPNFIFNLSSKMISFFIAKLWDCDGGITNKGYPYYATISKQLANDLIILLNKIGINAYISLGKEYKSRGIIKRKYMVLINDKINFYNKVGKQISSENKLERITKEFNTKKLISKDKYIPTSIVKFLYNKYYGDKKISHIDKNRYLEYILKNKGLTNIDSFYKIFDKGIFDKGILNKEKILLNIIKNYTFHTIKEIKYIGKEKAYDLEIENNHNYVVGKTLVSNCIYQEQIMAMAQTLAGYSLGEADILRRAIGKKKKVIIQEQRAIFIEKGVEQGNDAEVLGDIYDKTIIPAAEYSFNKSHGACYAFIAYQTAWLKTYYPTEFAIGNLMTSDGENLDRVAITYEDLVLDNITLLPIDINKSNYHYEYVNTKSIRMGMITIKGVGEGKIEKIIEERRKNGNFENFNDFIRRCKTFLDKTTIEALLKTGAFEKDIELAKGLGNIANITAWMKLNKKQEQSLSLFDLYIEKDSNYKTDDIIDFQEPVRAYNNLDKSSLEFDIIGINLRYHPFSGLKSYIEKGIEKNSKLIYTTENNTFMSRDNKKVFLFAKISKIFFKKTNEGRRESDFTLIGHDYIIKGELKAELTNKYEVDLKRKDGYFVELEGNFNANGYGKSLKIDNIKFIEPIEFIENIQERGFYNKKENLSYTNNILYKNTKIPPFINIYLGIYEKFLKKEDSKEKLINKYLPELKTFLEKQAYGNFKVFLKGSNNSLKETGFCIEDFKKLQEFIKKQAKWCNVSFSMEKSTKNNKWNKKS